LTSFCFGSQNSQVNGKMAAAALPVIGGAGARKECFRLSA
jgi:hypothetical protein